MKLKYYICFATVIISCVEPFEVSESIDSSGSLVVNGMVTDQEEIYLVELSRSSNFFDKDTLISVTNAIVSIEDNLGNKATLVESSSGKYQSTIGELIGQVGRSYRVNISLENGKKYQSDFEELLSNQGIESISTSFNTKSFRDESNFLITKNGFDVELDMSPSFTQEPTQSFYRWRWTGTYEVLNFPKDNLETVVENGIQYIVPTPWPCSGWIWVRAENPPDLFTLPEPPPDSGVLVQVSSCQCCTCWVEEYSQEVNIIATGSFLDTPLRLPMAYIEADRRRFYSRYHIKVDQLSLTREAYKFWEVVKSQQNQGSLFDATLGTVPTNIHATNNDDRVLGFFGASSVKSMSKFIDRAEIPLTLQQPIDIQTSSCLSIQNSTNVKPIFW